MIRIDLPASEETIRALNVGDEVSLFGGMLTARDAAHKFMVEKWPEFVGPLIKDGAIYHCGPVVLPNEDGWKIVSAGPTTSKREEHYQAEVLRHYGARIVIGKGGMGEKTLAACQELGAVYVHVTGGAAALIADRIVRTRGVHMLEELGVPEAFWELEVAGFQGIVTMDSKGDSLHKTMKEKTRLRRNEIIGLK